MVSNQVPWPRVCPISPPAIQDQLHTDPMSAMSSDGAAAWMMGTFGDTAPTVLWMKGDIMADFEQKRMKDDIMADFGQNRLCILYGPGGVGKSSVLNIRHVMIGFSASSIGASQLVYDSRIASTPEGSPCRFISYWSPSYRGLLLELEWIAVCWLSQTIFLLGLSLTPLNLISSLNVHLTKQEAKRKQRTIVALLHDSSPHCRSCSCVTYIFPKFYGRCFFPTTR